MTALDPPPLVQHVIRFRVYGVLVPGAVGADVAADGAEEVCAGTGVGEGGAEAGELAAVVEEDFAVAGEVCLFEGGGGEGGFGVEEAGELGNEGFALLWGRGGSDCGFRLAGGSLMERGERCTLSRMSCN